MLDPGAPTAVPWPRSEPEVLKENHDRDGMGQHQEDPAL